MITESIKQGRVGWRKSSYRINSDYLITINKMIVLFMLEFIHIELLESDAVSLIGSGPPLSVILVHWKVKAFFISMIKYIFLQRKNFIQSCPKQYLYCKMETNHPQVNIKNMTLFIIISMDLAIVKLLVLLFPSFFFKTS